jgi:DtxR family transcriptional regulator, Mn-dependent transcriptional regulator
MQQLTTKQKMYLVRLYQCLRRRPNPQFDICIPLTQLADAMLDAYSNAVTNVKRLEKARCFIRSENGEVGFTLDGLAIAYGLIYRWHVVETFLLNVIGLEWDDLEDEVARLYATGSDQLIERMWQVAGKPQFSPFGEPMHPAQPGCTWAEYALDSAPTEQTYRVTRIITRDPLQLHRLDELGLLPGQKLHLQNRREQTGTVQLRIEHEQYVLERTLAEVTLVCEL